MSSVSSWPCLFSVAIRANASTSFTVLSAIFYGNTTHRSRSSILLHHLGVSASYSGLDKIWRERAKENISQASIVPNNPPTPSTTSTTIDQLPLLSYYYAPLLHLLSAQTHFRFNALPIPTLLAHTTFQSIQATDNKRNAEEMTEGRQSIDVTAKRSLLKDETHGRSHQKFRRPYGDRMCSRTKQAFNRLRKPPRLPRQFLSIQTKGKPNQCCQQGSSLDQLL